MLDHVKLLSQETRLRPASPIRTLFPLEKRPGMISLLAGKPSPDGFPFESMSIKLKPSAEMALDPQTQQPVEHTVRGSELESTEHYGKTSR